MREKYFILLIANHLPTNLTTINETTTHNWFKSLSPHNSVLEGYRCLGEISKKHCPQRQCCWSISLGSRAFLWRNRRPLMLEQDAAACCRAFCSPCACSSVTKTARPQCSLSTAQACWLSRKRGHQRRFGAKPSFIKRGDSSPEKWSDKKVSVVKLGTANQAVPPHPVFCQRIRNQVPPAPPPIRCVSEPSNCGAEEAEWGATPQNS